MSWRQRRLSQNLQGRSLDQAEEVGLGTGGTECALDEGQEVQKCYDDQGSGALGSSAREGERREG